MQGTLDYNPTKGFWFATGLDQKKADEIGLDWSTSAGVHFTSNIYAALAMWDIATPRAADSMFMERLEYEASWAQDYTARQFRVPPEETLFPFQRAGVAYKLARGNTIIADQPGLGKTAQSIVIANELGAERVLVVVPASVRLQWRDMFYRWIWPRNYNTPTGYPLANVVLSSKDGIYRGPKPHWTIISYDLIVRSRAVYEALLKKEFDLVIFDELHYLKSYEAQRTRALFGAQNWEGVAENAQVMLGLTGTPLPNRPRECYAAARAFDFDCIDRLSEDAFKARYNPSMRMPSGFVLEKVGRLPELQNRLRCNIMVRRMKRDVMHQLPEVQYELTYVEPNAGVKKALRAENMLGIDPLHFDGSDAEIQGQIATVRREMGEAKVPLVVEHLTRLLNGGLDKVVVFTWHRSVLASLAEQMQSYGVVSVPGGSTAVQKHQRKQQFIDDPNTRIFLGNILACGTGTDGLQDVCSMAVFAEGSWVPGDNDQAVDRLWRIGQTRSVLAQFLVAPGGMDERVLGSAIEKTENIHHTLDRRA